MEKTKSKGLYWALIITFIVLYVAVAFVSTLHAITFFQLANSLGLAILLGGAYEVGQAAVLFSILMTENKDKVLAWGMMFLLTALQVTANVYASFKFMDISEGNDWTYWQRAILFAVKGESAEMYKIIISWISGALLPLVALGMTALVAENIRLAIGGVKEKPAETPETEEKEEIKPEVVEEIIENEVKKRLKDKFDELSHANNVPLKPEITKSEVEVIEEPIEIEIKGYKEAEEIEKTAKKFKKPIVFVDDFIKEETEHLMVPEKSIDLKELENADAPEYHVEIEPAIPIGADSPMEDKILKDIKPVNKIRGWHFKAEYVDDDYNVFHKGKFIENNKDKTPTSKKA